MAPEDIARLHKEGRLNHLLNPDSGKPAAEVEAAAPPEPEPARGNADQGARSKQTHRVGREALRGLSADEIVRRHRAGELDHLIRGEQ
jgi:hypothetical protein